MQELVPINDDDEAEELSTTLAAGRSTYELPTPATPNGKQKWKRFQILFYFLKKKFILKCSFD